MKRLLFLALSMMLTCSAWGAAYRPQSVITSRPDDPAAVYFTPENFGFKGDGKSDVSDALQAALNEAKGKPNSCGILFVPEGVYRLSKTIYIPARVRLIGYGKNRPLFVLSKNSPGFQESTGPRDKGKFLFWFIGGGAYRGGDRVSDANSGTFYSSLINADIKIEDGNPNASAIRAHYAQHCSISNAVINVGSGRAGLVDISNHLENVAIFGGAYGLDTDKSAPGWPIMLLNTYFEGQRNSAILTNEGGLTIVNTHIKNVPVGVEIKNGSTDRLFMEDCLLENVRQTGVILSDAANAATQINLRSILCKNVPLFAQERNADYRIEGSGKCYRVNRVVFGADQASLEDEVSIVREASVEKIASIPAMTADSTPLLPDTGEWVNIRDLGAKGDGVTDDTEVFKKAIENHKVIYIPQGWYVVKDPLYLKKSTCLIGLHPATTVLLAMGGNPQFSGFGAPQPQLVTPQGGENIVCGIFLNADAYNYRAVNCKWMAGEKSYMFDVKFSGHDKASFSFNGQSAANPLEEPVAPNAQTQDLMKRAWDNQHWSLWITNGGGGLFRDIWTANEYSSTGLYVSHTSTPGRIFGMSLEHHLRNEATFRDVSNWKIYDFQTEEEAEGIDVQQMDLVDCHDLVFANFFSYRVSRMEKSYPSAIRTWDCSNIEFLNVHNYAHQRIKFTSNASLMDVNSSREARRWELARLYLKGDETRLYPLGNRRDAVEKVVSGFEFIDGLAKDSKGNVYFCEQRMRRIYRLDANSKKVTSIADFPWNPVALACDTDDNLLVVVKYISQPGYNNDDTRNAQRPLFGWKGSGGLWGFTYVPKIYSIRPDNPEDSFSALPLKPMDDLKPERLLYLGNRSISYGEFQGRNPASDCFVAQDGRTVIPYYEDLFRCSSLVPVTPGQKLCTIDEYHQLVYQSGTDGHGHIQDSKVFASGGDRGIATDKAGRVYVTDGNVRVYSADGKLLRTIAVPERPTSLLVADDTLYITAVTSLYQIKI